MDYSLWEIDSTAKTQSIKIPLDFIYDFYPIKDSFYLL